MLELVVEVVVVVLAVVVVVVVVVVVAAIEYLHRNLEQLMSRFVLPQRQ